MHAYMHACIYYIYIYKLKGAKIITITKSCLNQETGTLKILIAQGHFARKYDLLPINIEAVPFEPEKNITIFRIPNSEFVFLKKYDG